MRRFARSRRAGLVLFLFAALAVGLGGVVLPGDLVPEGWGRSVVFAADLEEEERQEAIDRHTERAWRAFRTGNYDEVDARMARIEKYAPESPLPAYLRTRVDLRRGTYDEALARVRTATAAHPDHRGLQSAYYDVLWRLGRTEEFEEVAAKRLEAAPNDLVAHTAAGTVLQERGRREEALAAYRAAIGAYSRSSPPEDVPWVARAAVQATWLATGRRDDLRGEANKLLSRRVDANPEDVDARLQLAELFRSQRGSKTLARATTQYRLVLKQDSEVALARVGLAQNFLVFWQRDKAISELERALRTNPKLVSALSLLASIHVADGYYEKADALLERAAAVNPHDRHARAVKAARLWITGDKEGFKELEQEALAWDPTDGRFYVTISDLVGDRQRRYDVAADLAQKAVATDPNDPLGYVTLGEAQMNLGRTEEARKTFETSIEKSKVYAKDVKRDNWLEVLDVLDDFEEKRSEHFVMKIHPSEVDVMESYLPDLMEASWDVLTKKYGYTPKGPVVVDAFHRNDDFSVRSIGVKGLPALGICFGEVIGILGPTARPLGQFSWAGTAWHEFAHTITLGLSKGQVPRWLTEGLSVYEEKMRRPTWVRPMQRMLYDRWRNGRLLRMAAINRAFRGPDIGFAYFQGGLIAEHLTETRGFEVIPAMLAEFGKDRTTAQVFKEVLELELADYDRMFEIFVEGQVGDLKLVPRWDAMSVKAFEERVKKDPEDAEAWARLGWARAQRKQWIDAGAALGKARKLQEDHPEVVLLEGRLAQANERPDLAAPAYERYLAAGHDDFGARLFLAERAMKDDETQKAIEHLEAAKVCFPYALGKASPHLQLHVLYRGAGETEKAILELEAYSRVAGDDYDVRKELKKWYRGRKDHARVIQLSEEMIDISPFGANKGTAPDLELHLDYAEALLTVDRKAEAIREFEVQVALLRTLEEAARVEAGAVAVHVRLGDLYLSAGRPLDALEQAVAALRLSPDDPDARMLRSRAEEAAGYR